MTKLLAVGVTGRARHGKDSVAEMFVRDGFRKFSFARALKDLSYRVNPLVQSGHPDGDDVYAETRLADVVDSVGEERAKDQEEVRRFYQELGTQARHVLGPDVWVDAVKKGAQRMVAHGHGVVFSDVRFPNEAEMVRDLGGVVIRVVRPGFENGVDPNHDSERMVDDLGHAFTLWNTGTGDDWQGFLARQLQANLSSYMVSKAVTSSYE